MGIRLQFVISFSARPIMRRFAFSFLLALPILAFLGVLVVAPLAAMLGYQDAAPLWSEMLGDAYYQRRIIWTVFQAAATVLLTGLLGVPIAWALARLQFAGRALVLRLLMLPFILPTLVAGMGVLALFGERGALWRGWSGTAALLLYGNVFFNLPVMIRAAYQGLASVPANRLAAAQTLGANAWQRFWRVELPVLKAWLAGGACLVFLYCFSGFGLALLLGGQRFATVEVEVYQLIAYELDMAHAAVLVWLVLGVTALAGLLYAWVSRRADAAEVRIRQPEKPKTWAERALLVFALFTLAACCALPLLAIAFQAAQAGAAWRVLWDGDTLAALWNTARFSGGAVLGAAVLGGTLVPPPVGRPRDWPSKAGSLRPVRAVVRVGVRSVSWTRPGRCVEVPMTSPSEVPRVLVVPAGRTAIWGPGSSSSAREATMKRVPGGACSWAVRKASSRALIRSASVETSRAVSTTVRSAPSARASGREGAKETDVLGELPGAPVASCALGPTA